MQATLPFPKQETKFFVLLYIDDREMSCEDMGPDLEAAHRRQREIADSLPYISWDDTPRATGLYGMAAEVVCRIVIREKHVGAGL